MGIGVFFVLVRPNLYPTSKTPENKSLNDLSKDSHSAEILRVQAGMPMEDPDPLKQQQLSKLFSEGDSQASFSYSETRKQHLAVIFEQAALNTTLPRKVALNLTSSTQEKPVGHINYWFDIALFSLNECQLPFYVPPSEFWYGQFIQNYERCPSYAEVLRFDPTL